MSRNGGFPVDDEDIIETVLRILRAEGETQAVAIMRGARCRFERTGYDNLDGGTYSYTLYVEVAAETFVSAKERHADTQGLIGKALSAAIRQFRSGWYTVELSPLIVSMPGRPDLEGGPVTRGTRKAILDLIRDEGVVWHGSIGDLEFLEPIFDLRTLPSADSRFDDAAGDIWQHRVNNEDWSEDWIFSDDRFALLDGPDVSFLRFVERLVATDVRPDQHQRSAITERLSRELRRDGWSLVERETLAGDRRMRIEPWDPLYRRTEQALRTSATVLSSSWMHQEIERIQTAIDTDPALAIGTAKEMVETCCKHIADGLKLELPPNPDLPVLVKTVLKGLQLVPEGVSEQSKGADSIKRTLSSLSQITQGLGELRKFYGTGHGRRSSHRGLGTRHARLAVASAFVEFAVSTYLARQADVADAA